MAPRSVLVALIMMAGCGARTGTVNDDAGPACPSSDVRGVVGTLEDDRCALEGRDPDGIVHRMECRMRPASCVWLVEGVETCRCAEPDWANTCPNGVPICLGWGHPFDFANDVEYVRP